MAIPAINVLGNPNVTEGNFQIAIEDLRKSVIGSGKAYDPSNTYSQYDTCVSSGVVYYSKVDSNTGNTPTVGTNWGLIGDLITGVVHNVGNETVAGVKNFTTSPTVPVPTATGNVITMDNIIQKTAVGIGYGNGAGGTVIQPTSKSTSVILNKPSGQITMNNATLAAGTYTSFGLNNTLINSNDGIILTQNDNGIYLGANYDLKIVYKTAGYCIIMVKNVSASSLSDTVIFRFDIIKGANS